MSESNEFEEWIEHAEDDLDALSRFAVATRYPGAKPTIEDAKEAIEIARAIRKFSRAYLGLK